MPPRTNARVDASNAGATACCTSDRSSRSDWPAAELRLGFPHRQRRIVGRAGLLQPPQQIIRDRIARSVLDAHGSGVERVGDIARRAGMNDERQLLRARRVDDRLQMPESSRSNSRPGNPASRIAFSPSTRDAFSSLTNCRASSAVFGVRAICASNDARKFAGTYL